jgi:hypothetical protein
MNTGRVVADEFGAFADEVLNAGWIAPALQAILPTDSKATLQSRNTRTTEQPELDVDAYIGMMYRAQS